MKLLGLTGGIGMGKSTAAGLLKSQGISVVDTDAIAHQLVEPGQPALHEIESEFGSTVIGKDHQLDRAALAELVFADPSARKRLELILHPRIRQVWLEEVGQWRREGRSCGVVVIPLLFETAAEGAFNSTVCVACSRKTQRTRLLARGWKEEQIRQRIRAQWPVEQKMSLADFVIWTEGSIAVHSQQLQLILSR